MNLRLKRTPGIYVVGFMASGKSTIGRALAHRMGWSFFDSDDEIEAAEKTTIAEIFDARGEAEFRRIEAEILRQHVRWIERGRPAVLALGGGAFAEPANRELILPTTASPSGWIVRSILVQRRVAQASHRPLARDPEEIRRALPLAPRSVRFRRHTHSHRKRRPGGGGGGDPGAIRSSRNEHPRSLLRRQALAIFKAALAAADPADAVIAAPEAPRFLALPQHLRGGRGQGRSVHGAGRRARAGPADHRPG